MAALLHPDRLFPSDSQTRGLCRSLYSEIKDLPIISPHGHTDPTWFATNDNFANATELFVQPDHYVFRMLYSQGVALESLGVGGEADPRAAWKIFADNFHLFRGTPSAMWLNHVFQEVFGFTVPLSAVTADVYFDKINAALATDKYKPRALFQRFGIEVLCTTDEPTDSLAAHETLSLNWGSRLIPCFRPDSVLDPEHEMFATNLKKLRELTELDTSHYKEYLEALRRRRKFFKNLGATSTDHGHPDAFTIELSEAEANALFLQVVSGKFDTKDARMFRGHMLMKMAEMSLEDGLVMQLHPGSYRNHNTKLFKNFGRDVGADIPKPISFVKNLKPFLNRFGNEPNFTFILFTLDEDTYSRELAPLAGHYPAMRIGPPWWFHDSPEGMRRYYEQVIETAGFYNTAGFNDDTRAFLSIPARHDVFRRMLCRMLGTWVSEHRLNETEAHELAKHVSYDIVKKAYKL